MFSQARCLREKSKSIKYVKNNRLKKCMENFRNPQLPVMVWLHGGGFSFGSGNTFLYGPDFLVAEDVVLVTLNYRLGPFGFLTAGPDAPGNQGLKVNLKFAN